MKNPCPRCNSEMLYTTRRHTESSMEFGMSTLFAMKECMACGIILTTTIPILPNGSYQRFIEGGV